METKVEIQEVSLAQQIEQASPLAPKRRRIKTPVKKRQSVITRVVPFPSILEPILEEEEEDDDEDNVPLNRRTRLARATEQ